MTTCSRRKIPEEVEEGKDFTANLNPDSLQVLTGCKVEPHLKTQSLWTAASSNGWAISAPTRTRRDDQLIFNRTARLKDAWAKIQQAQQ